MFSFIIKTITTRGAKKKNKKRKEKKNKKKKDWRGAKKNLNSMGIAKRAYKKAEEVRQAQEDEEIIGSFSSQLIVPILNFHSSSLFKKRIY